MNAKLAFTAELMRVGKYDEAQAMAQDVLAQDSMNDKATYLVGVCHLHKSQGDLAIASLSSAVENAPDTTYRNYLGTYRPPCLPVLWMIVVFTTCIMFDITLACRVGILAEGRMGIGQRSVHASPALCFSKDGAQHQLNLG